MIRKFTGIIIIISVLIILTLINPIYVKDRKIIVVDDKTDRPISDAVILLIVSKQAFNPVDATNLWRKEVNNKTDQEGSFIIQDSIFKHPSRFGRASGVILYICKTGYWPSSDTIKANLVFISFLTPSDLQREHRLKKVMPEEYMSEKYFRSVNLCPEFEDKRMFYEKILPEKVNRFKKNIFSNNREMILNAIGEMSGSSTMRIGSTHTGDILDATGKILTHDDPAVRKAACKFFSDYSTPTLTPEIMKSILPLLEDSSSDVRAAAGDAVATHGKEAVSYFKPVILDLLASPEPEMQKIAVRAISKYSEYQRRLRHRKGGDPDIVSPLRKVLYHTTDEEQIEILLYTLGNLGYPDYFKDLKYFYSHPNPRIQSNVITKMRFEISLSERDKVLPYFVRSLKSPDSNVRNAAVAGLYKLGDKSHIKYLEALLKTEKQPRLQNYIKETISRLEKK